MEILDALTLVLIVLKLIGAIEWSWLIVVLPTLIHFGISLLIGLIYWFEDLRDQRNKRHY